jgi:hypothetical protein
MALCSRCKKQFRTLSDEVGDHACPHCGLSPQDRDPCDCVVYDGEYDESAPERTWPEDYDDDTEDQEFYWEEDDE